MKKMYHRHSMPENCIAIYRLQEGLNLPELSELLGLSGRNSAAKLCAATHPSRKYVRLLASHEGLSMSEFFTRYAPELNDAA